MKIDRMKKEPASSSHVKEGNHLRMIWMANGDRDSA